MAQRKFADGANARVKGRVPQYGGQVGTVVSYLYGYNNGRYELRFSDGALASFPPSDLSLAKFGTFTRQWFEEEVARTEENISQLELEIAVLKTKIRFMDDMATDTFDPLAYKAYKLVEMIKSSGNRASTNVIEEVTSLLKDELIDNDK